MSGMRLRQLITLSAAEPELQQWLRDGLERYKQGEPLDKALAIAGPLAVEHRDNAIRVAAGIIDTDGDMATWAQARLLSHYLSKELSAHGNQPLKEALRIIGKESKYSQGLRSVRRIYDLLKETKTVDALDMLPPPTKDEEETEHD